MTVHYYFEGKGVRYMIDFLDNVDLEKRRLKTLSGKVFEIEPYDLPTCATWLPTTELKIDLAKNKIINNANGSAVRFVWKG